MKHVATIALMIFLAPAALCAGSLRCTLPPEVTEAHLLSAGTPAMTEHLRAGYESGLAAMSADLRIDKLDAQVKKAQDVLEKRNQAYADTLASIRKKHLSSLSITLEAIESSISPSSSALGDVTFFYTARNSTDRIITDITYTPRVGGKPLPTTTSLVLEFIHPETLISGVGPGETMTNRGHDPERFSFFISELTREEIGALKTDATQQFGIEIIDMHFADQKGYKGQVEVQDFLSAFSRQLKPLQHAIDQAEADMEARKNAHAKALAAFTEGKEQLDGRLKESLAELKKNSIRCSVRPDKKNRIVFDSVPAGTYYLYAPDGSGGAVFEEVAVSGHGRQEIAAVMKKDPFVP